MLNLQVIEQLGQARFPLRLGDRFAFVVDLQFQNRAHVVLDIELAEYGSLLRQIAQTQAGTAVDRQVLNALAVNRNIATAGTHQAHQHVKRGRLARPVRAQQTDDLAGSQGQRYIFDDLAFAKRLLQMVRLQQSPCGHGLRRHRRIHLGVLSALTAPRWAAGLGAIVALTRPDPTPVTALLPSALKRSLRFS